MQLLEGETTMNRWVAAECMAALLIIDGLFGSSGVASADQDSYLKTMTDEGFDMSKTQTTLF
jgi:hypothetical protein